MAGLKLKSLSLKISQPHARNSSSFSLQKKKTNHFRAFSHQVQPPRTLPQLFTPSTRSPCKSKFECQMNIGIKQSNTSFSSRGFCSAPNTSDIHLSMIGFGKNGQRLFKRMVCHPDTPKISNLEICDLKPEKVTQFVNDHSDLFSQKPRVVTHMEQLGKSSIVLNAVSHQHSFESVRQHLPSLYQKNQSQPTLFVEASEHIHPILIKQHQDEFSRLFPQWQTLELAFSEIQDPVQPYSNQAFVAGLQPELVWKQFQLDRLFHPSSLHFLEYFGAPQIAKLCVHKATAVNMLALSEAISLSKKFGVSPTVISNLARSWVAQNYNPWPMINPEAPASKTYAPGYSAHQMKKDLNLTQQLAQGNEIPQIMGKVANTLYDRLAHHHWRDYDFSSVQQLMEEQIDKSTEPQLAFAFTCSVCQTRQSKTFSKQSYTKGVVIVRCDGCRNLHLVADHLGWFDKGKWDLSNLPSEKWNSLHQKPGGIFELTFDTSAEQTTQTGSHTQMGSSVEASRNSSPPALN